MATQATKVNNQEAQNGGASFQMPGPVNRILDYPKRFRQFLHEVRVEMKQVTWPTRDDVKSTTAVVIVTIFIFGVFLFLVDFGVSRVVTRVIDFFRK
jgi:preprotein translocase subunit SecE